MTDVEKADSRIVRHIWRHIGKKSAREMAEDLGVSPEEVMRVKRDMVESVDELSIQVHRMKILHTLQELAEDAQERSKNVSDERNYSGMVNAAAGALDKLLKEFNRKSKEDQSRVDALNNLRVQELLRLMDLVVFKSVGVIAKENDLDEEELLHVFGSNLEEAARELEA